MEIIKLKPTDIQTNEAHAATIERLKKYFDEAKEDGREYGLMSAHIYLYADRLTELRDLRRKAMYAIEIAFEELHVKAWELMHITPIGWDEKELCHKMKIILDFIKEP